MGWPDCTVFGFVGTVRATELGGQIQEEIVRVLIAGAGGLIGSAVARHLLAGGHDVQRLVRAAPGPGEVGWDPDGLTIDAARLEGFDAVIDLASAKWPPRWTASAKREIYDNRVRSYRLLAETLAGLERRPRVLVCASGMGIYPSSADEVLSEDSATGSDFLAGLQRDGEDATTPASTAGIRVVHLRIPTVVGGTNLAAMIRNLRPIGSGRQWWSWVALDEIPPIVEHVLVTDTLVGPVNVDSPNPVRNAEFVAALARVCGRRPGRAMPAILMRLAVGEMADALFLASRRMEPRKLLATGYRFHYPELEPGLRHQLATAG
jgi:hypothetical protein